MFNCSTGAAARSVGSSAGDAERVVLLLDAGDDDGRGSSATSRHSPSANRITRREGSLIFSSQGG